MPFQPWARDFQKKVFDSLSRGRSSERCLPSGVPQQMLVAGLPFKIVQTPRLVVVLFEEFVDYRQIFTDNRPLPEVNKESWFGYSVGRWDADTLIVESIGFNKEAWLTNDGYPRTEALRLTERFRRVDLGRMDVQFTFDDPGAYTKPWSATARFEPCRTPRSSRRSARTKKDVSRVGK